MYFCLYEPQQKLICQEANLLTFYACRVYYDADLDEGFTNPGEWPWVALIFNNGKYIG